MPNKRIEDAFKSNPLRKIWKKIRDVQLKKQAKYDKEFNQSLAPAMKKQFDQGLGPLLDKWEKEVGKWPKTDPKKLGAIGAEIGKVMASYKAKIDGMDLDGKIPIALKGTLDQLAKEIARRNKTYQADLKKLK